MDAGRYSSDSSVDCRLDPLGPLSSAWAADGLPLDQQLPYDTYYALIDRDHPVPRNCVKIAEVDRDRNWRRITMTYVARCRQPAPALAADAVSFARPLNQQNMFPALWAYAPQGWVMRGSDTGIDAAQDQASLYFRTPAACLRTPCELVLDADAADGLLATVNGVPAPISTGPGAVVVRLPAASRTAWVTFQRGDGAPVGLRVHRIRAVPAPS
jgi:hypothetical protein